MKIVPIRQQQGWVAWWERWMHMHIRFVAEVWRGWL